jgi:hypothetical protein
MERKEFFPRPGEANFGIRTSYRTERAWQLLSQLALVAGKDGGEDSTGRARIVAMLPEETVARAFALADAFVDTAIERGGIREVSAEEVEAELIRAGELSHLQTEARWKPMQDRLK